MKCGHLERWRVFPPTGFNTLGDYTQLLGLSFKIPTLNVFFISDCKYKAVLKYIIYQNQ